ncbi:DUF4427 domain-containing protein [Pseudomonas sp. NLJ1]|uniref:DUF4427 domain-containing protein n=1 Tax=Pseudomonas sp. NLJ1 TaxID=3086079 RepID=UPI003C6C5313
MTKGFDIFTVPRVAHYFRDVDLHGNACPEFVPESFPTYCQPDDDEWSAGLLQRIALRLHHLWPTYGIRNGERTIRGKHPAVCFTNFSLSDLSAVRDGFESQNGVVTQYAITIPVKGAEEGGIQPVIQWVDGRPYLQDGTPFDGSLEETDTEYRFLTEAAQSMSQLDGSREWRWRYSGNYHRSALKIQARGLEGSVIPGLNLTDEKWSGIGIVVPNMPTARLLQYDILSLIDKGLVSETHFDHILVCDRLPVSLEGMSEEQLQVALSEACFDFKSCLEVSSEEAAAAELDFHNRLELLESTTPREPEREYGGCWLWFQDNDQPYVRALIKAGRVKPNLKGRYLADLSELRVVRELRDPQKLRDLRDCQNIASVLSKQLKEKYGVRSTYFSVLKSYSPDDDPAYAGRIWGGGYFILPEPDEDDEDDEDS